VLSEVLSEVAVVLDAPVHEGKISTEELPTLKLACFFFQNVRVVLLRHMPA